MDGLVERLQLVADERDFSGVVRVHQPEEPVIEFARGFADRVNQRPNALSTRFAVASATKGLTALTVMSLVEEGAFSLDTELREIVGEILPAVDAAVTVDHLLTHRSGSGDYIDEEAGGDIDDHVLGELSAHALTSPLHYLSLLNRYPQRTDPDLGFVYNNSGFVILSIIIESVTGSFHDAVRERVLEPAGMTDGGFLRSDRLPVDCALGYLQDGRTNIFHLPVIGAGDGGSYLTLNDVDALWDALFSGRIVSTDTVDVMTTIVSEKGDQPAYGRGFWLDDGGDHVRLVGMDAGVSFTSGVKRESGVRYTVISNTSPGAWAIDKVITGTS